MNTFFCGFMYGLMILQEEYFNQINVFCTELDDDDIVAQALLFYFAGFETVSTLLCFASHQLAVHPDIQARLQKEIDDTLNENEGKLKYEAVHSMKYLDMVVSGKCLKILSLLAINIIILIFKYEPL